MIKKLFVASLMLTTMACFETKPEDCKKLALAKEVACATPSSKACGIASTALVAAGCVVDPTPVPPTPSPVLPTPIVPTPLPTVEPTNPSVPTPLPTAPPATQSALPKPLADGAQVYMNNKVHGQGIDSTVRVRGDEQFCYLIHGVKVSDCHLEGWPKRTEAELELAGGCPIWQYRQGNGPITSCRQVENDASKMSCDHFGSVEYRDDPITAAFEGRPEQCGLQRDGVGNPMAGFWVVAHGKGQVRACVPNGTGCGPWVEVDH